MALYATTLELASYLQQDLDAASATLALTLASGEFAGAADTAFAATTATWSTIVSGCFSLELPFKPVVSVQQARVNGVVVTGWTLRTNWLFRPSGFGYYYGYGWPPDQLDVDLTYGYATVPDDVKLAVLEIAAGLYEHPSSFVVAETIDDYSVRYNGTPILPGRPWRDVAAGYRGLLIG